MRRRSDWKRIAEVGALTLVFVLAVMPAAVAMVDGRGDGASLVALYAPYTVSSEPYAPYTAGPVVREMRPYAPYTAGPVVRETRPYAPYTVPTEPYAPYTAGPVVPETEPYGGLR